MTSDVSPTVSGKKVLLVGAVLGAVVFGGLVLGFLRVGEKQALERVVVTDARVELAQLAMKIESCGKAATLPKSIDELEVCVPEVHGRADLRWFPNEGYGELERDAADTKLRVRIDCRSEGASRECRHGAVMDTAVPR